MWLSLHRHLGGNPQYGSELQETKLILCGLCAVQYFLWYGILGTIFGRKLLWLTRLLRPLGELSSGLFGISGGRTVLANKQPFAHTEEFVTVRHSTCAIGCHCAAHAHQHPPLVGKTYTTCWAPGMFLAKLQQMPFDTQQCG
jgi:hypothetical protein